MRLNTDDVDGVRALKKENDGVCARVGSELHSLARAFRDELGLVSPFLHTPRHH